MNKKVNKKPSQKKETHWDSVSAWYSDYLKNDADSYHAKVIIPNLVRLLGPLEQKRILDIGCGEGSIAALLAEKAKLVDGLDGSKDLIAQARARKSKASFYIHDATVEYPLKHGVYDHVISILSIQNMAPLHAVCKEVARSLTVGGSFSIVTLHPAFRIPKDSDWYYDETKKTQGRVVYSYLSEQKIPIQLHPSKMQSATTTTFHRPLQVYSKCLQNAGFMIKRLEEWTSHKESEKGPRKASEDKARLEIPMFLYIEAVKQGITT